MESKLNLQPVMLILLLFFLRVLRDNPLVCSCDLYWLQQWQRNERCDLDNQMLFCISNDQEVPLNSLVIDNCSEFGFHFDIVNVYIVVSHLYLQKDVENVTHFRDQKTIYQI